MENHIEDIIELAQKWKLNDADKQQLKVIEEVGELCSAILRNDIDEIKDAIGDIAVTVIIWDYLKNHYRDWTGYFDVPDYGTNHNIICLLDDFNLEYLENIAREYNTSIHECLDIVVPIIQNRTGKTVNGTFIKDEA